MAHTFDTSVRVAGSTANPVTTSLTPGATATILVVGISVPGNTTRAGGAPTFGGITMLQAGTTQASGGGISQAELWYLSDPPTGAAATLSVPNAGALNLAVVASTYSAAPGLRSVLNVTAQASGNSTNPTVSLTTTAPGCALVSVVSGSIGALTAGRTLIFTGLVGTVRYGAEYNLQAAAGTLAMNWTATTGRWATVAASFMEVSRNSMRMMGVGT